MLAGAQLIAEGREAAPPPAPPTAFLRANVLGPKSEYKQRCRDEGRVMYHMHVGLSTWSATEVALAEVHDGARRARPRPSTGSVWRSTGRWACRRTSGTSPSKKPGHASAPDEWRRLGEAAPIQPHLGDYMIGFPAGLAEHLRALSAGVTTIGNVGQYTAYELIGGSDEILVTEETVRALAAIGGTAAITARSPTRTSRMARRRRPLTSARTSAGRRWSCTSSSSSSAHA